MKKTGAMVRPMMLLLEIRIGKFGFKGGMVDLHQERIGVEDFLVHQDTTKVTHTLE